MMDTQIVFDVILGIVNLLGGFILNIIWTGIRDLQQSDSELADKVRTIEVLVAGKYVTQEDFKSVTNAMFLKLDKIFDRLDQKQDKLNGN